MRKVVEYKVVGEGKKYLYFMIAGAVIVLVIGAAIAIAVHEHNKNKTEPIDIEAGVKNAVDIAEDVAHDVIVGEEGKVEATSRSSLKDVVEINNLQTFEYTYNSTCSFSGGKGKELHPVFYVAYEGTVTFSIDTNDIKVDTDEESKYVYLTVPDLNREYSINAGTLEYIFVDEDYENDNSVPTTAYKESLVDLQEKAEKNDYMLELARSNTEHELEALIKPIVSQMFGNDFNVVIEWDLEGES